MPWEPNGSGWITTSARPSRLEISRSISSMTSCTLLKVTPSAKTTRTSAKRRSPEVRVRSP